VKKEITLKPVRTKPAGEEAVSGSFETGYDKLIALVGPFLSGWLKAKPFHSRTWTTEIFLRLTRNCSDKRADKYGSLYTYLSITREEEAQVTDKLCAKR